MTTIKSLFIITLLVGCTPTKKQKTTMDHKAADWVSLFDGKTLNGWHLYNGGSPAEFWTVEDGALAFNPPAEKKDTDPVYNIVTHETFTSFELSLEWKIS